MSFTLHTPETIYSLRHVPSWLLLAAAAGMVNGFGFLMCQQFVSHVTGTVTRLGLEWTHATLAAEYAVVLLAFLAGAVAAVVSIHVRTDSSSRTRWATPLFTVATILLVVAGAGAAGLFGAFGGSVASDPPPVLLLSALAFAMGMQNAAVASTTGLAVRTTHLTGPMTDLGIHLATALVTDAAERNSALRGALLRGGKIFAFMVGAGVSVSLAGALGYLTLLAPATFILLATVLSFVPNWSPSDLPVKGGDKAWLASFEFHRVGRGVLKAPAFGLAGDDRPPRRRLNAANDDPARNWPKGRRNSARRSVARRRRHHASHRRHDAD